VALVNVITAKYFISFHLVSRKEQQHKDSEMETAGVNKAALKAT